MNILYVSDLAGMGGGEVSLLYIMHEMSKYNQVYLLCRVPGSLAEKAKTEGVTVFCYDFKRNLISSYMKFRKILKDNLIDVVHSNELTTGILHGVFLKMMFSRNIKNVCTCHGQWYKFSPLKAYLINKHIIRIFCVSKSVQDNLVKQKIRNTTVSYLGVPDEKFNIDRGVTDSLKQKLGIKSDQIVIITVARFQKIKAHLKGVEAIRKMLNEKNHLLYLLIGDNTFKNPQDEAYKEAVFRYVEDHHLKDHVYFLGERDDIPELMSVADFVMIPSDNESFGMVAIEAIASNRVIISTPCDGVREILLNDENMIAKENSSEGLYLVLKNMLEDDQIFQCSKNKISYLKQKYSVREICKKYQAEYQNDNL